MTSRFLFAAKKIGPGDIELFWGCNVIGREENVLDTRDDKLTGPWK